MEEPNENSGHFPRTTHLYKSNLGLLDLIKEHVDSDPDFISCNIVHSASDLGLTHKIIAEHSSNAVVFYDGLFLRVTEEIASKPIQRDELLDNTGTPIYIWDALNGFAEHVNAIVPDRILRANPHYTYYTIQEANWGRIGIRRSGNAQIKLVLNDPNYFTLTALIFSERGKDFDVYFGEENTIHQMLAHDFFIEYEIYLYIHYFNDKINTILKYNEELVENFGGINSSFRRIRKKHKNWNEIKNKMNKIYKIKDLLERGVLLSRTLQDIIDKKWAFFNGPRQIWILGEKQDSEEKIQHPITHFFEVKLDNGSFILPDNPIVPYYTEDKNRLQQKLNYLEKITNEIYERTRDLLTAYQTEFSIYAVWLAVFAVIISILPFNFQNCLDAFNAFFNTNMQIFYFVLIFAGMSFTVFLYEEII